MAWQLSAGNQQYTHLWSHWGRTIVYHQSTIRRSFSNIITSEQKQGVVCCASTAGSSHAPRSFAFGSVLLGVGSCAPENIITNDDLAKYVETSDEWIAQRTGIRRRRVIGKDETLSEYAAAASKKALEMANVNAEDIDLIIMATSSPDDAFGSACSVQSSIGAKNAVAFDLTAACTGFLLGLTTAAQYIRSGSMKNILIIGADCLSRYVDWTDRRTCILFGDGAGAVVMSAREGAECSLLGMSLNSDGKGRVHLYTDYTGVGSKPLADDTSCLGQQASYSNVEMNGQEVFKFAVRKVPACIKAALKQAELEPSDVDWVVMHQANQRILDAVGERLSIPMDRIVSNLADYGNTSAASIPLVLDEAVRTGKVQPGNKLAMAGFGAGLTWGGAIVRWG